MSFFVTFFVTFLIIFLIIFLQRFLGSIFDQKRGQKSGVEGVSRPGVPLGHVRGVTLGSLFRGVHRAICGKRGSKSGVRGVPCHGRGSRRGFGTKRLRITRENGVRNALGSGKKTGGGNKSPWSKLEVGFLIIFWIGYPSVFKVVGGQKGGQKGGSGKSHFFGHFFDQKGRHFVGNRVSSFGLGPEGHFF